jgi:membrane-bound acyltransferase YfiQ involved in biofilm formation
MIDRNVELQLENQGKLLIPFVLVSVYWGVLASVDIGRQVLIGMFALWALSTILAAIARKKLATLTEENANFGKLIDLLQKVAVIIYTIALVPVFLLMNLSEKRSGKTNADVPNVPTVSLLKEQDE